MGFVKIKAILVEFSAVPPMTSAMPSTEQVLMQCLIHQLLLLELPTFQKQVLSRPPPHLQSPSSLKVNAIYFHITTDVYFPFEYAPLHALYPQYTHEVCTVTTCLLSFLYFYPYSEATFDAPAHQ